MTGARRRRFSGRRVLGWFVGVLGLLAGLGFTMALGWIWAWDPPHEFADVPWDVAVVLSGDPGERTSKAVEMHRLGKVSKLLFTGQGVGGDNAEHLAAVATHAGVPQKDVLLEKRATNTCENVRESWQLLFDREPGVQSVVVVTDRLHVARTAWHVRHGIPHPWQVAIVGVSGKRQHVSLWLSEAGKLLTTIAWWHLGSLFGYLDASSCPS